MSENAHGVRRFTLAATVARNFKPLPVHGFGLVVYSAPADASAVLQLGDQDGAQLPLRPGLRFRSPVPFDKLYLSNVAGASGNVDFLVITDPQAEAAYGGLGDITMSGVAPQMDDTDKQAVSVYGKLTVPGDTPLEVRALSGDGQSDGYKGLVTASNPSAYNGATWDRMRGNESLSLPLAMRSTTTLLQAKNYNGTGLALYCRVTDIHAGTPSITLRVRWYNPAAPGEFFRIWGATAAITAVGEYAYLIDPGAAAAASWTQVTRVRIPRDIYVEVDHADAQNISYNLGVEVLQ